MISKNFQRSIKYIVSSLMILFMGSLSMIFAQTTTSINQHYFFSKKPFIHPKIIQDLQTWISDTGEQVVAINVPGSMDTNRYFGDITVAKPDQGDVHPTVTYTDSAACNKDHPCPFGPPFFSYRLIGKTSSGIYVLFTEDSGGGSGVFENLLLVRLEADKGMSYDEKDHTIKMNRRRLLIKRLTEIPLGDRYRGAIVLEGNELHIGKNQSTTQTGLFKKDTILKIEAHK